MRLKFLFFALKGTNNIFRLNLKILFDAYISYALIFILINEDH